MQYCRFWSWFAWWVIDIHQSSQEIIHTITEFVCTFLHGIFYHLGYTLSVQDLLRAEVDELGLTQGSTLKWVFTSRNDEILVSFTWIIFPIVPSMLLQVIYLNRGVNLRDCAHKICLKIFCSYENSGSMHIQLDSWSSPRISSFFTDQETAI